MRHESLLGGLRDLLEGDAMVGVEVMTRVGGRFDLGILVEDVAETAERQGGGSLAVVVSGPAGMADGVRLAVARVAARGRVVVEFLEESYSW